MNKHRFVQSRQASWKQFESLLDKMVSSRGRKMTSVNVADFSRLLREVSGDLAVLRTHHADPVLIAYVNGLATRGHDRFYRTAPTAVRQFVDFVVSGFPRLFRANFGYFAVAALLFFGPLAITWAAVQNDPLLAFRIISAEQLESFDQMYGDRRPDDMEAEEESENVDSTPSESEEAIEAEPENEESDEEALSGGFGEDRAAMAGFYVQHNVGIALQCFARGILLGIGTTATLLYNGIVIGAVAGYVLSLGHTEKFLSFVVSHGSFELTAIAIAGGAGLMIGDAFVHPGQRTRLEALRVRGLEAVQIAGGAAVMLMIAALIEAFWSPSPIPAQVKYGVGAGLWCLVVMYLGLSGSRR